MKKNVVCIRPQRNFLPRPGTLLLAAAAVLFASCKPQLIYKYNGAVIQMPQEIDCVNLGDTLYVLSAKNVGKNRREIQIGYRQDSVSVNKRFNIKN